MKKLIVIALTLGLMGSSFADIQDPPANDYGPRANSVVASPISSSRRRR
jgi:hypothetical protein